MSAYKLHNIIKEELTRPEITALISNKINSKLESKEFEKTIRKISSDVVGELFKILWQQKSFWENRINK